MSQTAVELTAEELELIQQKRAADEKRAAEQEARQRADYERWMKREVSEAEQVVRLADQLRVADTKGILLIEEGTRVIEHRFGDVTVPTRKVTWFLNGREEKVDITFHSTSRYSSFRSGEMKYFLCGDFNDYNQRYYKRAATVIARIEEYQTIAEARRRAKRQKATLAERATAELTEKYPNAEVTFHEGYDYRGRRGGGSYAPDRICVATDNGSYTFRFYEADGEIKYSVYQRKIADTVEAQVRALILGA